MQLANDLSARRREFARAVRHRSGFARDIRDHKYEKTPGGILFPRQHTFIGSVLEHTLNHADPAVDPNLITTEGLNHLLDVLLHGSAQVGTWNMGLFSGNVVPLAALTGVNWNASLTEFVGYSEATRVAYVEGAAAGGITDNDGTRAEFTITAPATIYGGVLCETQAKAVYTNKLLSATRFAAGRAVIAGDTLQVKQTFTATST